MSAFRLTLIFILLGAPVLYSAQSKLAKKGGRVSLDFHEVPVKDVITAIAEITGKNFIIDDNIRGKVSIISPSTVSIEEAYEAFLMALDGKSLQAVDEGKFTRIMKKSTRDIGQLELSDEYTSSGELITRIVSLKFIDANTIREALRRKTSLKGSIIAYGPTNSLFITDTAGNVRRLEKLISMMDKENFKTTTEVIPLKYSQADDISNKIQTIIDSKDGGKKRGSRLNNIEGGQEIVNILPDNRTNSLLVTATRKGLEDILDLLSELDRPITDNKGMGKVHIRRLKHANANELAGLLANLFNGSSGASRSNQQTSGSSGASNSSSGSSGSSSRTAPPAVASASGGIFEGEVKVTADPGTNSLLITASASDYGAITPVIDELDVAKAQVFVEAMIMEVNMKKVTEVGVNLIGSGASNGAVGMGGSFQDAGTKPLLGGIDGPGFLQSLAKASGLVLTAGIPGASGLPISGATLNALQTNGYVNVLSSPTILTTDNKKAEIVIGERRAVKGGITQTVTGTEQGIDYRDIDLKLAVTPQINDGDAVTLEIEQKIEDLAGETALGVNTTNRQAMTTVVAQNGQTITLGGLIKDKESTDNKKVPLFGDIPLIGHLFKQSIVNKEKVNLMLFLTPHIIRSPEDLTRVSVKKNNERRKFNQKNGIRENQALYDYDLDKGLNMAPPASSLKVENEERRHFDYQNFDPSASDVEGNSEANEALTRRRETYSPSVAAQQKNEQDAFSAAAEVKAPAASSSSNPFADIQPPSSN